MRRLLILGLLLANTISAQARLGETRDEIIRRFGKPTLGDRTDYYMEFKGDNLAMIAFDDKGRSALEFYYLKDAFKAKDATEIVRVVIGSTPDVREVQPACWQSTNGRYKIAMLKDVPSGYDWGIAVGLAEAVDAGLTFDDAPDMTSAQRPDTADEKTLSALEEVNRGWQYELAHDYKRAAEEYQKSADERFGPGLAYLASLYARGLGVPHDYRKAVALFEESIRVAPHPNAWNNYAWFLATCPDAAYRDGQRAVFLAKSACEMSEWKVRNFIGTLAAAYAECGDFESAIFYQTAEMALEGNYPTTEQMQADLKLFQQRKPVREAITI
jgi:tetratricopeptide (TPR) repeat protein